MIAQAAAAGFDGLELLIETDGELSLDTSGEACRRWARQAGEADLRIVVLACKLTDECNLGCELREMRERGRDRIRVALERAAALGAGVVSIEPAVVGNASGEPPLADYEGSLSRVYEMLCALSLEAERCGVVIGVVPAAGRFLLSPVETRRLIDRVNSPFVGVVLDAVEISSVGYPQQWITTLGQRIAAIRLSACDASPAVRRAPGEGATDLTSIERAAAQVYYRGPLVFTGPGSPEEILAWARHALERRGSEIQDER